MRCAPLGREELLAHLRVPWVVELHETLAELLTRDRTILSLGSGQGEYEVPGVLDDARLAFPGFSKH